LIKNLIIVYIAHRLSKVISPVLETQTFQKANKKAKPPFRQFGLLMKCWMFTLASPLTFWLPFVFSGRDQNVKTLIIKTQKRGKVKLKKTNTFNSLMPMILSPLFK
jgi:hypothetical protein